MKKMLYIDDDPAQLEWMSKRIRERFGNIELTTCPEPVKALALIDANWDLLVMDLEMPLLDGKKLLFYAKERGLACKKIIIFSSRPADYLHELFPMGECLCVLNKMEPRQLEVLDMVLSSLSNK
jgi:CheY-like chemotaxis protein